MTQADFSSRVGPALARALETKGFTELMPVQEAVLDPELAGRDLRVSSQTGSGKTVAIGLAIRDVIDGPCPSERGVARPRALVVVPTRELARQVDGELGWLYAPQGARVASATGGASYRDEHRAFAAGPAIVVGTPGRLLDHLQRGTIDPSQLGVVVLDEADQMLDLGFRDDLEAILAHAPEGHRTHLVSATFPREVRALADRVQRDPAHIEGTPLGTANTDIDHLVHLVAAEDRVSAIVNLLLATPGAQTLVFARTRADVAAITRELSEAGFQVRALSGEMEQRERNQALAAFKRGGLDALVATDVAARGIDVQDIARVVHAEPPTDTDTYTHRSGRTGRAGRKGTSSVLATPAGLARTSQLLRRAGVRFRMEPIPTADALRQARDERIFAELTADDGEATPIDAGTRALAERLAASPEPARAIARLLAKVAARGGSAAEPRTIRRIDLPTTDRAPRAARAHEPRAHESRSQDARSHDEPRREPRPRHDSWVPFRFTWGREHGADPRRLLAMACRRGGVQASDIGSIQVARTHSIVDIAASVAEGFARAAAEHDPRDPRVTIRAERGERTERVERVERAEATAAPAPRAPRDAHRPVRKHAPEGAAHRVVRREPAGAAPPKRKTAR